MMDELQASRLKWKEKLLTLQLFQTEARQYLRDLRPSVPKIKQEHPCQDYDQLVDAIIEALLTYEWTLAAIDEQIEAIRREEDLMHLRLRVLRQSFIRLREHRKLPPSLSRLRIETVDSAFATVLEVYKALRTSDAVHADNQRHKRLEARHELFCSLMQALRRHGPKKGYPADAIYPAVACIVNAVGMTNSKGQHFRGSTLRRAIESWPPSTRV